MKRFPGSVTMVFTAMISAAAWLGLCAGAGRAGLVNYEMVTVADEGNAPDTTGYGAVDYEYRIGKYDVTVGQYAAFLNAVAADDTYGLYNTQMSDYPNTAGIARSGSSGSYAYSVIDNSGSSENRPITWVSWFDAARFANWMANGQPVGAQVKTTTEDGAYSLNGALGGDAPARNTINPNANVAPTFWIPSENEWYKAAYYSPMKGGAGLSGYWSFATQSDTAPGHEIGDAPNQANYYFGPYVGSYPNGEYTTGGGTYSYWQNYLTDVGAFTGSASFYGTFDQSGNVTQWNDLDGLPGPLRGLRGGHWNCSYDPFYLSAAGRYWYDPSHENEDYFGAVGIRLAGPAALGVPEIDPGGAGRVMAIVAGVIALVERRRRPLA